MFGRAKFDLATIYDVTNPDIILSLAFLHTEKKIMYFSNAMEQKLNTDDAFYKNAICLAASHMTAIGVQSRKTEQTLNSLVGHVCEIQIVDSPDKFEKFVENYVG